MINGLTGKFLEYTKKINKVDVSDFNVDSFVIKKNIEAGIIYMPYIPMTWSTIVAGWKCIQV